MHILTFFLALVLSVLSGMGVGSGGLFTLWLTLVEGQRQMISQGINLLVYLFSASGSVCVNFSRLAFDGSKTMAMAFSGALGCIIGSLFAKGASDGTLRICFALPITLSGTVTAIKTAKNKGQT